MVSSLLILFYLPVCVTFFITKIFQIKEDPEKWEELKRAEAEYEKRRVTMATYSEAVRHAQQVQ